MTGLFLRRTISRALSGMTDCPLPGFLVDLGVDFQGDASVQQIEPEHKRLRLANGDERSYEKLLLATGAAPRRLDVPGRGLPHLMVLRSLRNCRRILANVISGARVAVVGGSFIAMEAAASLFGRGLSVDVISPEEHPLEKVFGRELSDLILELTPARGCAFTSARVARIEDKQVLLQGGERIDADIVVVGIGVEPRLQLAKAAGLTLDRGVVVNSRLQTSDPNIFAAGDIARWPDPHTGENIRVEHWVVAERQGQVGCREYARPRPDFHDGPLLLDKALRPLNPLCRPRGEM